MKTGDVVELKSGGPKMTISNVAEYVKYPGRKTAMCTWFDKDGKHHQEIFEPAQLKIIDD